MKIQSVRYGRTVNRGNFESERFDIEIALDEGDTFADAFDLCKGLSAAALDNLSDTDMDKLAARMDAAGVK